MMGITGTICSLCGRGKEELQFRSLFTLSDAELSQLTCNIILVIEPFFICSKCCQELALVGKLLYNWRAKITVSLESGNIALKKEEVEGLEETLDDRGELQYIGSDEDDCFLDDDYDDGESEALILERHVEKLTNDRKVGQKLNKVNEKTLGEEKEEEPHNSLKISDGLKKNCHWKTKGEKRLNKENCSPSPVEFNPPDEEDVDAENVDAEDVDADAEDVDSEDVDAEAEDVDAEDVDAGAAPKDVEKRNARDSDFECSEEGDSSDWEAERPNKEIRRRIRKREKKKELALLKALEEKPTQPLNGELKLIGKQGRKKTKPEPDPSAPKLIGRRGRKKTRPPKPDYSDLDPTCPICGKFFTLKARLKDHIARHSQRHVCDTCGMSFNSQHSLRLHMNSHSDERPHKCDICGKTYKTTRTFRDHQMAVHGEEADKKHLCSYCPAKFHRRIDRKRHEMIHTEEKPFQCRFCPKSFGRRERMQFHERTHGERRKDVPCRLCGNCYYDEKQRNAHEKMFHNPPKRPCPFQCGKMFRTNHHAREHAQRIHGAATPGSQVSQIFEATLSEN